MKNNKSIIKNVKTNEDICFYTDNMIEKYKDNADGTIKLDINPDNSTSLFGTYFSTVDTTSDEYSQYLINDIKYYDNNVFISRARFIINGLYTQFICNCIKPYIDEVCEISYEKYLKFIESCCRNNPLTFLHPSTTFNQKSFNLQNIEYTVNDLIMSDYADFYKEIINEVCLKANIDIASVLYFTNIQFSILRDALLDTMIQLLAERARLTGEKYYNYYNKDIE